MEVRWDAAVQGSRFWQEAEPRAEPSVPPGEPLQVQVWLFGRLAVGCAERPIMLRLRAPLNVRAVIAELARRCGGELAALVTAPRGGKLKFCRVFVDGEPAEDADAPLQVRGSPARVEMILLTGIEGG
jgi:hypothetical protein